MHRGAIVFAGLDGTPGAWGERFATNPDLDLFRRIEIVWKRGV